MGQVRALPSRRSDELSDKEIRPELALFAPNCGSDSGFFWNSLRMITGK